jgi:transcriptional regulator with PAS, ATPase and Fis domain
MERVEAVATGSNKTQRVINTLAAGVAALEVEPTYHYEEEEREEQGQPPQLDPSQAVIAYLMEQNKRLTDELVAAHAREHELAVKALPAPRKSLWQRITGHNSKRKG